MSEVCPYCKGAASVRDSAEIYGRSYGMALICDNYPTCKSYATLYHEGRYMADAELRQLRKECHDKHFDPLWKYGGHLRTRLYRRMREVLDISKDEAHFGKLNKDQCRKIITSIINGQFVNPI